MLGEFKLIASKVKSDKKSFVERLIRDADNELEWANGHAEIRGVFDLKEEFDV